MGLLKVGVGAVESVWRINGESIFTALLCLEMFW